MLNKHPQQVVVVFLLFGTGTLAVFLSDLANWAASASAREQQYLVEDVLEITKPNLDAAAFTF
jgi:hypothetical protein